MNLRSKALAAIAAATVLILTACNGSSDPGSAAQATRLQTVKDRGRLNCLSHVSFPGFGFQDAAGTYRGFDIDLCRAVAAAVLGDPDAVDVRPRTFAQRADEIRTGEVDVLAMTTTWTPTRDAEWGNFTAIMFYNGQGFMVRKDSGYASARDMDGASVCVTGSTTTELNLAEYFQENGLRLEIVVNDDRIKVYEAYEQGDCDAVTDDVSALEAVRPGFANPEAHKLLPEIISKEPLSPLVPHGDEQWFDIVKTVMYVLINAEELGVTQDNVEAMKSGGATAVRRMLGAEGEYGQAAMGLDPDFAVAVIKAVGNYGEIYDRYMGPNGESFTMPRGPNNLWTQGGLIYAPPLR